MLLLLLIGHDHLPHGGGRLRGNDDNLTSLGGSRLGSISTNHRTGRTQLGWLIAARLLLLWLLAPGNDL